MKDSSSDKLVLEVYYDIKEGTYRWNYPHRLNAFMLIGILGCVKDDLIYEIREASENGLDSEDDV